jgi:hypothetical protein
LNSKIQMTIQTETQSPKKAKWASSCRPKFVLILVGAIVYTSTIGVFVSVYLQQQNETRADAELQVNLPAAKPSDNRRQQQQEEEEEEEESPPTMATTTSATNTATTTDERTIRRWGCQNSDTPFVFVHIGKAGGGTVRQRIALSQSNLTTDSTRFRDLQRVQGAYYPVTTTTKRSQEQESSTTTTTTTTNTRRATLCNSDANNYRPVYDMNTFEGTRRCNATTPIGQALACHFVPQPNQCFYPCTGGEEDGTCPVVYLGHNMLGSELHWLPAKYFQRWWETSKWAVPNETSSSSSNTVASLFLRIASSSTHPCWNTVAPSQKRYRLAFWKPFWESCMGELQAVSDAAAVREVVAAGGGSWASVYASLPAIRVTILREPFSWLVSKYMWHLSDNKIKNVTCDDLPTATQEGRLGLDFDNPGLRPGELGWIRGYSLVYLFYLCGEDCIVRYHTGISTLDELERQAEGNLRHSFAVVGLLNETNIFFDMIAARVQYMNTSLNGKEEGSRHRSTPNALKRSCESKFKDESFRSRVLRAAPELRAMMRLFQVAEEVNRFQMQELQGCSPEFAEKMK